MTTIYVTHDQIEAMSLSDSIAVMQDGRVVQRGSAEHIYNHPATRFVAGFAGKINFLDGRRTGVEGDWDVMKAAGARLLLPRGIGMATSVTLGVRLEHVATGALNAFLISFTDVTLSIFLAGADAMPLPVRILESVQTDVDSTVPAISTLVFLCSILLTYAAMRLLGIEALLRSGGNVR